MCPLTPVGKYLLLPLWLGVRPFFRALFRIEVIGKENIPEGACIVASNHRSHLDPPVLNAVFPEPLVFLAKEELFKPPFGGILKHMRAIPLRRGSEDISTLEECVSLLKLGCKIGIFPEGTRANPGEFKRAKPGVGFLAINSGFPVLPVYIDGTDRAFPRGKKFPKPFVKVSVVIGKPLEFKGLEPSVKNYKRVANEIMEEIKKLAQSLHRK